MMTRNLVLGCCVAVLPIVGVGYFFAQPHAMTAGDMESTKGGVIVTNFAFPPGDNMTQTQDNLQFRFEVKNLSSNPVNSDIVLGIFEGTTKHWSSLISLAQNETEMVRVRVRDWPLQASRDATVRYVYFNAQTEWSDAAVRKGMAVGSLPVGMVRFYHLVEQNSGFATAVSYNLSSIVDNETYYYPAFRAVA